MRNEYQSMINAAGNGRITPQDHTWDRIAPLLDSIDKDDQIKRLSFQKRLLALSACVLLAMVVVLTTSIGNPTLPDQSTLSQADQSSLEIFDVQSVHKMHKIYQ